jgi:hypothetical protein
MKKLDMASPEERRIAGSALEIFGSAGVVAGSFILKAGLDNDSRWLQISGGALLTGSVVLACLGVHEVCQGRRGRSIGLALDIDAFFDEKPELKIVPGLPGEDTDYTDRSLEPMPNHLLADDRGIPLDNMGALPQPADGNSRPTLTIIQGGLTDTSRRLPLHSPDPGPGAA